MQSSKRFSPYYQSITITYRDGSEKERRVQTVNEALNAAKDILRDGQVASLVLCMVK